MQQQIAVRAFGARPSTYGRADEGIALVDVDFAIEAEIAEIDDSEPQVDIHCGAVTLARHPDPLAAGWGRWGDVDHWLDARTVALIRERRDREDILEAIEAATALAAEEAGL